ncbi:MAG: LecA/PA-IL family lectin [Coriobacteriia bacterium]
MEQRKRILGAILLIAVLVALWYAVRPFQTVTVTVAQAVAIPFEAERVPTAELPVGSEAVIQQGKDGRKVVYTYFAERRFLWMVLSRTELPAGDRPTERVEIAPVSKTIEYGTATRFTSELGATAESGVELGPIGSSGVLLIEASGVIRYMKGVTTGPEGDPTHDYTFVPIKPDANVGALLVRVDEDGPWMVYTDLPLREGMRVIIGAPGESVRAVVNDAPGLFEDNAGTFAIQVIAR